MKQENEGGVQEESDPKEPIRSMSSSRNGNEAFLGKVILFSFGLGIIVIVVFGGMLAFRIFQDRPTEHSSIAELSRSDPEQQPKEDVKTETPSQAVEESPQAAPPLAATDIKTLEVLVLNGGAAKGSAGAAAETLKKAGYAKATIGNSQADFSGVVVYYRDGSDAAAKAILELVARSYPKAQMLPADPKKPETSSAPVVVMLGK